MSLYRTHGHSLTAVSKRNVHSSVVPAAGTFEAVEIISHNDTKVKQQQQNSSLYLCRHNASSSSCALSSCRWTAPPCWSQSRWANHRKWMGPMAEQHCLWLTRENKPTTPLTLMKTRAETRTTPGPVRLMKQLPQLIRSVTCGWRRSGLAWTLYL